MICYTLVRRRQHMHVCRPLNTQVPGRSRNDLNPQRGEE